MCGVLARLGRPRERLGGGGRGSDEDTSIERGLDALARRGPDGRGVWRSPDGVVVLGHTRLAIVDVERGAQPIVSDDGTRALSFNGEIYGHAALRRELEAKGHRFRSRCDAEIVLRLYEEHGLGMLPRLRGEFAFVVWDARERTLFAARDRFGIKPLVYATHDGMLLVASRAKALFACGVPASWDHDAFFQAASLQYTPPRATLFAGVRVLPPGHFLVARADRPTDVRIERHWDLDYPPADAIDSRLDMRAAAEALRERLEDAVRERLVADVPVAFQLSGGIDSSAVLALAARHLDGPAHAFTVAFGDGRYDERAIAEEMAARVGARHVVVTARHEDLLEELPAAVADGEGLAINAHLPAKRMLARAVHDAGFKVVLTGEGADEVLAGYAHLRCDLDETRSATLARDNAVSAGLMLPDGDMLDTSSIARRLGFVPTWLRAKASLGRRVHALLRDDWLARFADRDPYAVMLDGVDATQLRGRGPVEQASYLWSKLALEGYILRTLGDGMEMAASVEGRLPFLDHLLFELVRTFPTSLKIAAGVEKAVLREAVGPLLTERLRARQKHPFLAPPLVATEGGAPPFVVDRLLGAELPPFFSRAKVEAFLGRIPAMTLEERTAAEPALMLVTTASLLHAHYRL